VTIEILDTKGSVIRELAGSGHPGINRVLWDARAQPRSDALPPWRRVGGNDARRLADVNERPGPIVAPGDYRVRLRAGPHEQTQPLTVERDK
jgi:hypothetical protein